MRTRCSAAATISRAPLLVPFLADAPAPAELIAEILARHAVQGGKRDHDELVGGLGFQGSQSGGEGSPGLPHRAGWRYRRHGRSARALAGLAPRATGRPPRRLQARSARRRPHIASCAQASQQGSELHLRRLGHAVGDSEFLHRLVGWNRRSWHTGCRGNVRSSVLYTRTASM